METQYEKKITWGIKNFSTLQSEKIYSDQFVVSGCKWRLLAYPKGSHEANYFSLYLNVADTETLPSGWRRHAKFRLTVVNQLSDKLSKVQEIQQWFEEKSPAWGSRSMSPLNEQFYAKDSDFLVNGELKIVAEIVVLEVAGKVDVTEETSTIMETMNVNGFQLLPSQVDSVKSLFEKHPEIASRFSPKNPHLRATYLNVLLSLTEILNKSAKVISNKDLVDAYSALRFLAKAGFKLDWLEKKLKEVGETRMQEIEEELKGLKHKCEDMDALVEFLR